MRSTVATDTMESFETPLDSRRLPYLFGFLTFAVHAVTASGYGIFRDELYYLACAEHLAFGYVDHPPLIAVLTAAARSVAGDSLVGLRLFPALAAGATSVLSVDMARRIGGRRFAQVLTGLCVLLAPVYLSLFTILTMNAFDVLFWAAMWWTLVNLLLSGDQRLWLVFGLLAGFGLQNKISVLYLGAGLIGGILITSARSSFRERWIWLGGVVAGLLFLPHVLWQITNDWPTLEFIRNAQGGKIIALSPLQYLSEQILLAGPVTVWVALIGLAALLFGRPRAALRPLGLACLFVLLILLVGISKPYYLSPVFTLLFAAGAVVFESWTARRLRGTSRAALVALVLASGLLAAPLAKPLLPVESFVRYEAMLGLRASSGETNQQGRLPQYFADMFGWEALADTVAAVVETLPEEDREVVCVAAQNYGQAGAIDFFGPDRGLPPAISGHNNYWIWGPRGCTGDVLIVVGDRRERLEELFEDVHQATRFRCANCMPYEADKPVWICRRPRVPLQEVWPRLKNYV